MGRFGVIQGGFMKTLIILMLTIFLSLSVFAKDTKKNQKNSYYKDGKTIYDNKPTKGRATAEHVHVQPEGDTKKLQQGLDELEKMIEADK